MAERQTRRSIEWLLGACCFASLASMRACDTLLPALSDEFSVTVGQAARTIFVFAIAYGACQLCFGPLGDRYGKLRTIAGCALACVIGNGMAFAAPGLDWLVVARIVSGGCAAGIFPLAMAWIGDNVSYDARQEALARLVSAGVTGMLAGQWLSGVIAQWIGWRPVFAMLSFVFLVAGSLLLRASSADARQDTGALKGLKALVAVFKVPRARWILTVTTIEGAFAYGALAFIPSLLQRHHQVSLSTAGGIAAFYAVGGFIYSRMAARLLRRIGEPGLAALGGLLSCTGYLSFAYVPSLLWTPVACALAGFGFYSLHNTLQTNATQMAPAARGSAMSLFACVLFLGQSLGIMAAAWIADHLTDALIFAGAGSGLLVLSLVVARGIRLRLSGASS
ncbi:Putative MFS family arabinose efflux permease OS=Castellaniella defragrans OX=75697 GN=HNR28_001250 PE=4 SV=1 [Castellaniella defragrans]